MNLKRKKQNQSIEIENKYANVPDFIEKDFKTDKKAIVKVKNLAHKFDDKIIYEDLSFDIYENEKLAFLGSNGVGKTLTVATICGYMKQKAGEIEYDFNYQNNPHERLAIQFQDLQFPSELNPNDLIDFIFDLNDIRWDKDSEEYNHVLELFQIKEIMKTKMRKLSGGQQQRVNVFLAMLGKPKILFLDEFTTGLDISIKTNIQNYIKEFCEKNEITLVIISHDIDSIEELAERIIILGDKKIKVNASVDYIKEHFGSTKNILKKYIL